MTRVHVVVEGQTEESFVRMEQVPTDSALLSVALLYETNPRSIKGRLTTATYLSAGVQAPLTLDDGFPSAERGTHRIVQEIQNSPISKLYGFSPHGTNYPVAFLSNQYEISGKEVRDHLRDWFREKVLSLKNSGITLEEWERRRPNDDFIFWPLEC